MYFKKIFLFAMMFTLTFAVYAKGEKKSKQNKNQTVETKVNKKAGPLVQIVLPVGENLSESEKAWLPGQLQDKIKSNLQDYLNFRTVVDSKSEKELAKLQAQSENDLHDENDAIELGKLSSAKMAVFSKVRKTANGYVLSLNYTDLTTGEEKASVTSKEYTKSEYLYGTTGAVDETTLKLAEKLETSLSEVTKNLLANGSADFTVDAQLALAKQNEEAYRRQQKNLDVEIAKLSASTDINAVQNKKKLEAEKALLAEKQNAEAKRQQELAEQKKRAAEDEKLEAERSIALKTQRDQMAKDAAAKAAEVRKLKLEKQGVLGQINVIESKKKALVEIRQGVETRCMELYNQLETDRVSEEQRIRNRPLGTSEKDENGNQTEQSKQRRENQVISVYENLTNKFFADCDNVKNATTAQESSLLAEIRDDQKALSTIRTVSSMGDELKVSFGAFDGGKNGWVSYISLYSDGVLIYTDSFIVNYEALSGKKQPTETELEDFAVADEYDNNIDMYNSLLTRGDPIIYFEIDYNVTAEGDGKPSQYKFNFSKIRVINTVSGKVTQTSSLNKVQPRTMKPEWDLREIVGIVTKEKAKFNALKKYIARGLTLAVAIRTEEVNVMLDNFGIKMVDIPGKTFSMLNTEVTQELYTLIMGKNPSNYQYENNPVEMVSWFDAVYFCNKLSEILGFTPVYSVNGNTNPDRWGYTPHYGRAIRGEITQNTKANGFRLPTVEEWQYAAKGGVNYTYSGSNYIDEVGWYSENSGNRPHPVAQKKANGYGLYDMSGNVMEWCWDVFPHSNEYRYSHGGSCYDYERHCMVSYAGNYYANYQRGNLGFRIVCNVE